MRKVIAVIAVVTVSVAATAHAKPPPGTDLSSPEHAWWECQHQPAAIGGTICCDIADGHVLKDVDWKIGANGHYKVRVGERWFDVPPERVIQPSAQCGAEPNEDYRSMAKVWYAPTLTIESGDVTSIMVYCFMSGQMY